MKLSRPVLRWHGGKWNLADWVLGFFPEHRIYTEVYGGAGSVLMKKSRCYSEVYNDLDGNVVNLFRVLQGDKWPELVEKLRLTPFARQEFELSYETSADPLEAARRLVIRCFMGFGSGAHNVDKKTGFRSNSNRSGTTPAHDWKNYPENLAAVVDRLRGVVIENRPAVEVLRQHDGPDTLHYVDPPYVSETRDPGEDYSHEMDDNDHRNLAAVLRSLTGGVVLSGYACDLYDVELYPDWHRESRKALADGARERTEVLWMNDWVNNRLAQKSLF